MELNKAKNSKDGQYKAGKEAHAGGTTSKMLEINISQKHDNVRYGIWINPNPKPSFRHKPIDFTETLCQVEVPKPMLQWQLAMRVIWFNHNPYESDTYSKDFVVVRVYKKKKTRFSDLK